MVIQWFPGHMTKALRMMEAEIKNVDIIIYVLDSRAPFSSVNPKFKEVINNKPIIYAFNKIDLADMTLVKQWQDYFKTEHSDTVVLNSTLSGTAKQITTKMKEMLSSKIERNEKKGIVLPLRAMVLGVPNSGKSTLINNLCKKGKTVTGNKPGVTKGKQWVKIEGNFELLDTPGTLWPSFDNIVVAKHLAYIGSIRDQVLDVTDLAFEFLKDFKKEHKENLNERYNLDVTNMEVLEIYESICASRGFIVKGGEFDYLRAGNAILDDFRKGRMGQITLDNFENVFEGEALAKINKKLRLEQEKKDKEERKGLVQEYKKRVNKKKK